MEEIWKDIPNYEGYYQISNLGKVKALKREIKNQYACGRYLALQKNKQGYYYVDLSKDTIRKRFNVHRLVALTFIPNPLNKPCINHIDGIKTNNNINNLEWCSYSENTKHAIKNGLWVIKMTDERKNKIATKNKDRCSKPVNQLLNDKIIKTFYSIAQAQCETKIYNLSRAIKTKTRAGGYHWQFAK